MVQNTEQLNPETWPTLSRAPVVEGLIDIRVDRSPAVTIDSLRAVADSMANEFPSRIERRAWISEFAVSESMGVKTSARMGEPDGLMLRSADQTEAVQFRLDGFTYSRLAPYTSWADLAAKATALWPVYRNVAQPARITRVGVRYINRLSVPPGTLFEETFRTTFTVSPSLPQAVAGFLLRLAIPFESDGAMAVINQTMDADGIHCILDLEAYAECPQGFAEGEAWAKIEVLRQIKNRLFFQSITLSTLETFK